MGSYSPYEPMGGSLKRRPLSHDAGEADGFNLSKAMHSKGMKIFRFVADKALSYFPATAAEYRAVKYGVKGAKLIKKIHDKHHGNKLKRNAKKDAEAAERARMAAQGKVSIPAHYAPIMERDSIQKAHGLTIHLIKNHKLR